MLHKSFKPAKCKTALKLAASRIKLLKNKKEVQIKQVRREVAQLLESGQVQTARIRVEHVIKEEKTMGAYELIEIYCELIAARLPIIESQKHCPIDLKEAIASLVFASPRSADIPELMDVRKHFLAKYGKDFISAAVELRPDCGVNRSLVEKLSAKTSDGPTKMKMLTAITEEHNIKWDPNSFGGNDGPSQDDLLKGPSTFDKASRLHEEPSNVCTSPIVDVRSQNTANDEDSKNFPARTLFGHQNIRRYPERVSSPVNSHLETQSSGTLAENIREGSEARRGRHSGDASVNYMGRPDWNMEFTDATAAAQAAAESAERASMAARAAAELSSSGKVTAHYGPDSHGFREERLERPLGLRPPGEVPSRTQVNNASVAKKFGKPDEHIDSKEENSARDQNGQNDPRKTNPEVGSKFHGVHVGGVVGVDNTVDSEAPDTCSNQGDDNADTDSLSGMTKKLYRDAYKKSSNSNSPEHQAAGKYTETNPWSTELDHDCISDEQSGRKNSLEEVNISSLSEIHAGKDSAEYFVNYAQDMQETYGSIKDSSSFAEKQFLSSLDEQKAEDGLAENLFAYEDGKRISMGNKTTGEGAVVFDDYGLDEDVENVFDLLDKDPKSSHTSSLPHVESHLSEDSSIPSPGRIMADSFKMSIAEDVPEAQASPEMEENFPVTFDDSDGLSSENEVEPKPRDSKNRSGVQKTYRSSEFAPVGEAGAVSNSGNMLALGNLTGGRRNKSHVPPRDNHGFSSSNAASTDKDSDEGPDIHYGDGQVEGRPNRRMQTNAVSHEVTVPPPRTGARPIVYADDEEEFVLDADYWKKSSTRPVANDYVEKNRLSSLNSRQSDSDGKIDIAKEHQPRLLSGKSSAGSAAGLSPRTKPGNQRDAEDLGFSLGNAVVGENSAKLRAQANESDSSESYGRLKWRSETKDDQVSEPAKASVKEDETASSSPSRPSLDSAASREDSFTQARHVHPKMPPDYDSLLANLQSLRANRQ